MVVARARAAQGAAVVDHLEKAKAVVAPAAGLAVVATRAVAQWAASAMVAEAKATEEIVVARLAEVEMAKEVVEDWALVMVVGEAPRQAGMVVT